MDNRHLFEASYGQKLIQSKDVRYSDMAVCEGEERLHQVGSWAEVRQSGFGNADCQGLEPVAFAQLFEGRR